MGPGEVASMPIAINNIIIIANGKTIMTTARSNKRLMNDFKGKPIRSLLDCVILADRRLPAKQFYRLADIKL
jgi:hypothetical protein